MARVDSVAARVPRERGQSLASVYVATFVIAAGNGVVFPLLADLQDEHDLPTYGLGIISGVSFIASLLGMLVFSGQADRGRAKLLMVGGLGLSVVSMVLFALSNELWQFTFARAMSGLAFGCFAPATRSIVARLDADNVGRNLGRLASTELGGFITGPVIGATFASAFNLDAPFWALAVVVAIVLAARRAAPHSQVMSGRAPRKGPRAGSRSTCCATARWSSRRSSRSRSSSRSGSTTRCGRATCRTVGPARSSSGSR